MRQYTSVNDFSVVDVYVKNFTSGYQIMINKREGRKARMEGSVKIHLESFKVIYCMNLFHYIL